MDLHSIVILLSGLTSANMQGREHYHTCINTCEENRTRAVVLRVVISELFHAGPQPGALSTP